MEELFGDFIKSLIYAVICLICIVFFVTGTFSGNNTRVLVDDGFEKASQVRSIDTVVHTIGNCTIATPEKNQTVMHDGETYIIEDVTENTIIIVKQNLEPGEKQEFIGINPDRLSWVCEDRIWLDYGDDTPDELLYTVHFNASPGSVGRQAQTCRYGKAYYNPSDPDFKGNPFPTPVRTGWYFIGWFTGTSDGSIQVTETSVHDRTKDIYLYAKWSQTPLPDIDMQGIQSGTVTYQPGTITQNFTGIDSSFEPTYSIVSVLDGHSNDVGFITIPNSTATQFAIDLSDPSKNYVDSYAVTVKVTIPQKSGEYESFERNIRYTLRIAPKDITVDPKAVISIPDSSYTFEGMQVSPDEVVEVVFPQSRALLVDARDYARSLTNYRITSTEQISTKANLTIRGINNYSGTQTLQFEIKRKEFEITYNLNGGSGTIPNGTKYWGVDCTVPARTPTLESKWFTNWSTNPDGTGDIYKQGDIINKDQDMTLYAQYTENEFALNLKGVLDDIEYNWLNKPSATSYAEATVKVNGVVKGEHLGQYDGVLGRGDNYEVTITPLPGYELKNKQTSITYSGTMKAEDLTLKPEFVTKEFKINFNTQLAGYTVPSITRPYKSAYGYIPDATKQGNKEFLGWYTQPTGGDKITGSEIMGASDVTLYAHWTNFTPEAYMPGELKMTLEEGDGEVYITLKIENKGNRTLDPGTLKLLVDGEESEEWTFGTIAPGAKEEVETSWLTWDATSINFEAKYRSSYDVDGELSASVDWHDSIPWIPH